MALLACGYPLWVQFHGPLTEHGSPWKVAYYKNHLGNFVTAPGGVLFHSRAFASALAAHLSPPGSTWPTWAGRCWPCC